MVASKRVTAAKSERFYKQGGKKKAGGFWSGLRKQLSAHPIVVAIIFFIMIFSGVATFFMTLPGERNRLTYGGLFGGSEGGDE
ncbi:hypothetical protein COHA_010259 [Chlorella ohadii]|uniref:Uncharacterized protein n=1 Tax=Chlorella ohadii TaxID=2649997 RepID=A0AAD5DD73_9CHLO|nr:hypothetical protein COHA_010259 [Chlorella ohadii]